MKGEAAALSVHIFSVYGAASVQYAKGPHPGRGEGLSHRLQPYSGVAIARISSRVAVWSWTSLECC